VGKLDGKVAFITGAARGQGAEPCRAPGAKGADIIARQPDVRDVDALRQAFEEGVEAARTRQLHRTVYCSDTYGREPPDRRDLSGESRAGRHRSRWRCRLTRSSRLIFPSSLAVVDTMPGFDYVAPKRYPSCSA
jgi:hypothetical protein